MIVTSTAPATPTNPAPSATARPKMFSLECAWTAKPWKEPTVPKPPEALTVPL